jgi:dienelactone hydrolase
MIQQYLARETAKIERPFLDDAKTRDDWERLRARWKDEYLYMLGLHPMPEKTPLRPTITGTLAGDGYVVEKLHYQSRPRLYVTANLYRPATISPGQRLPAVLYVCGHSGMGKAGNKTAFQSHGIWFARHGYVCLVLDTLQLGEIGAIHHGTYRENRWWWHSRGYTPAGVECLNGMRGIDYLQSRPDVDPERIAVTGISGGGAATFWIAAADERVKVAVPVSGMADLQSYVTHRVINGHCDCMFLYNTFQWPWTRIAALIAPRPLLFVNSDQDRIFPMDANDRVINRLERVYSLFGATDLVDAVVSIGDHAYRKDIRQAAYRFINMHLKGDPAIVTDSEVDIPEGKPPKRAFAIDPEKLRVFPRDEDFPKDELNTTIDQHFVPMATPKLGEFEPWKRGLMEALRRVSFRALPERIAPAKPQGGDPATRLETEPGIEVALEAAMAPPAGQKAGRVLLVVQHAEEKPALVERLAPSRRPDDAIYLLAPRGIGPTRWTRKNPPNYVERCHVLLGRTVDAGRVWDIAATARYLRQRHGEAPLELYGEGPGAVLAAYAALWEPEISALTLYRPALSHMEADAPQFLNVLRVCDVPDVLGMIAPRPLAVFEVPAQSLEKTLAAYERAGAKDRLRLGTKPSTK